VPDLGGTSPTRSHLGLARHGQPGPILYTRCRGCGRKGRAVISIKWRRIVPAEPEPNFPARRFSWTFVEGSDDDREVGSRPKRQS
jgi:hypothetical protein